MSPTVLTSAKTFSSNPTLPQGSSFLIVSAIDGGSNTKSNSYQISTKGSANQPLSYDRNGNLVSDGTNTYLWDAENRLIQINYPGAGNNSTFAFDPFGRCVQILETSGGTGVSTKQFVCCGSKKCEARSASGSLTSQYFAMGQSAVGSNFFYTKDHLGSVRSLTDSSGNLQAEYSYDNYGKVAKIAGTLSSDFQYGGYYLHAPSGLSLSATRAYSPNLGRWLNRDSIAELGGVNIYNYCDNNPVNYVDSTGLCPLLLIPCIILIPFLLSGCSKSSKPPETSSPPPSPPVIPPVAPPEEQSQVPPGAPQGVPIMISGRGKPYFVDPRTGHTIVLENGTWMDSTTGGLYGPPQHNESDPRDDEYGGRVPDINKAQQQQRSTAQ